MKFKILFLTGRAQCDTSVTGNETIIVSRHIVTIGTAAVRVNHPVGCQYFLRTNVDTDGTVFTHRVFFFPGNRLDKLNQGSVGDDRN